MAVWLLDDERRREALRDDGRMLHQAFLTNYAMNDAKALTAEQQKYHQRLNRAEGEALPDAAADARAQILAAQQAMNGD